MTAEHTIPVHVWVCPNCGISSPPIIGSCDADLLEACKAIAKAKGPLRASDAYGFQVIARAAIAKATP